MQVSVQIQPRLVCFTSVGYIYLLAKSYSSSFVFIHPVLCLLPLRFSVVSVGSRCSRTEELFKRWFASSCTDFPNSLLVSFYTPKNYVRFVFQSVQLLSTDCDDDYSWDSSMGWTVVPVTARQSRISLSNDWWSMHTHNILFSLFLLVCLEISSWSEICWYLAEIEEEELNEM